MVSIAGALDRIKHDPDAILSYADIEAVCRQCKLQWRDTPLKPPSAIALFIRQIAAGNVSCNEVVRLGGGGFTAAAYCTARGRLPLEAIEGCAKRVYDAAVSRSGAGDRWRGNRVWIGDGSGLSMPDTPPLQEHFGQSGKQAAGCGFPGAHVLGLFDLHSGLISQMIVSPLRTHDMKYVTRLHPSMGAGDVLLGDDAFGTYAHLALLLQAKMHGLFPVHHCRIVDFTPGRPHTKEGPGAIAGLPRTKWLSSLGEEDQLVEWFKPKTRPKWMSQEQFEVLPESITVRETRRTVKLKDGRRIVVSIVSTFLDATAYPAAALIELRQRRWEVEIDLRHLKTTMKMEVLKCKTVAGVKREIAVYLLVYNLVRCIMLESASQQQVNPNRISFADALHWARSAAAHEKLPRLKVNPDRPWRIEPRFIKRRPKGYPRLNKPRDQLRQLLLSKTVEA
jgi:hypothetical protein